jgi:hypothetical protein
LSLALREERQLRICENIAKDTLWTWEGGSNRRLEKTAGQYEELTA